MSKKISSPNFKNILLISPFARPNIGGVESHLDKLIAYLTAQKYYVTLLTYQPLTTHSRGLHHETSTNYQIYRFNWFGHTLFNRFEKYFPLQFLYLFPGLFINSFIYYQKNHRKIDCIHAHGLVAATIARLITVFHPKRLVVSTHAIYHFDHRPLLGFLVKNILSGFDKILAVSDVSQQELINMGISSSKVQVESKWIDTNLFSPKSYKNKSKYKFNVLFVGRLINLKGINLIINIIPKLPHIGFHIVGTGQLETKIKKVATSQPNLFYYGSLNQNNPPELSQLISLYNQSDYFISPYLYDEGYSQTLIESLSCGTPLIIPKRGSPPTFLSPDIVAYLPFLPTTKNLYHKLKLLSSIPTSKNLRQKCRQYALSHFSDRNAKLIITSYHL